MRRIAKTLQRDGVLSVDLKTATDILWTLTHADVYLLLVHRRGWKPAIYERWLTETLRTQLLVPSGAADAD